MTKLSDGRISKFHRNIYDWVVEIYPNVPVEIEKLIPSTNQRIDIYIDYLNIAIECDGTFHDKPEYFFVKTEQQWKDIVERDRKKEAILKKHGVKLVRVPYKNKLKSAEDLKDYIEQVEDPSIPFNESIFEVEEVVNEFLEKAKLKKKEHDKKIREALKAKNKEFAKNRINNDKDDEYKLQAKQKNKEFNKMMREKNKARRKNK